MVALFIDRGFPMEPFAEALAGEIDCRAEVGPDEAGDVVAIVTGTPPVGPAEVAPIPTCGSSSRARSAPTTST